MLSLLKNYTKSKNLKGILIELWINSRCNHVGTPNSFDFLHRFKGWSQKKLIKVANNLIEKPDTLQPLVVGDSLHVELLVAGDGGEHHAGKLVLLAVEPPVVVTLLKQILFKISAKTHISNLICEKFDV